MPLKQSVVFEISRNRNLQCLKIIFYCIKRPYKWTAKIGQPYKAEDRFNQLKIKGFDVDLDSLMMYAYTFFVYANCESKVYAELLSCNFWKVVLLLHYFIYTQ